MFSHTDIIPTIITLTLNLQFTYEPTMIIILFNILKRERKGNFHGGRKMCSGENISLQGGFSFHSLDHSFYGNILAKNRSNGATNTSGQIITEDKKRANGLAIQ